MDLKYVGKLLLDENGSYFEHLLGGKIRGKTMLKIFKEVTRPPDYCHICIDNLGQILILPPDDVLHTKPDKKWREFITKFRLLAGGDYVTGDTFGHSCSGVYI